MKGLATNCFLSVNLQQHFFTKKGYVTFNLRTKNQSLNAKAIVVLNHMLKNTIAFDTKNNKIKY